MKIEKLTVKKNGKTYAGEIAWPDDLGSAIKLLGELEVWSAFKIGYKELAKKRITNSIRPRKKWLKLDLSCVDDQTAEEIESFLRERTRVNQLHIENQRRLEAEAARQERQQAEETALLEAQQTAQNDYDETPEEAQAPISESADSFEQDFAKYLAALGSSPQQHTEKELMQS